ncbi:MAG: TonB-dependent receptor [Gammaproteobacteria bacterium]
MRSFNRAALAAFLCFPLSLTADAVMDLDDTVTVTATRTPLSLEDALAPVIVITGDELRRTATIDVAEALRFHAGIEIGRNGGPGQAASLFVRGTNSNHTQVLVDGVRVNPGTLGAAAIHHVRPADIERIEIVKGPRSTLYGTEAIGGVVNIITRRATAPVTVDAELGIGAHGTRSAGASFKGRSAVWFGGLRADTLETDGFPPIIGSTIARGYQNHTVHAHGGYQGDALRTEVRRWQATGNVEYVDFFGTPVDQDFDNHVTAAEAEWSTTRYRTLVRISRANDEIRQRQSPDFAATARTNVDWQTDWQIASAHELTTGASVTRERTTAEVFGAAFDETPRTRAVFAQWQHQGERNRALVAVRHSDHDAFGGRFSSNAEVGRSLSERWGIVAGAGTAFRAPDSTQRFGFGGNPALEPEKSRNLEVGLRGRVGERTRLSWQLFENRIDDLITFDLATFALENIDRARIRGSELTVTHRADRWVWRQSFVIQQPLDLGTAEPLPRRARRSAQSSVQWRLNDAWSFGGDVLLTGKRKDSGFSPDFIPGYALVNLSAEWRFSGRWTADFRVENALDAHYETALGFAQSGRALYGRVRWTNW